MRSRKFFIPATVLFLVIALLSACSTDQSFRPEKGFVSTNQLLDSSAAIINYGLPGQAPAMDQAFRQGYILVYGEGFPKADSSAKGQRRLTAQRAAEVVALKNLSDMLSNNGQYETIKFDTFNARIKPRITDFKIVSTEYNEELGKAVVLIRFDLRGATRIER